MKLLIDGLLLASPGMLRLRSELIRSIIKHRPENWEIIVILNRGGAATIEAGQNVIVEYLEKPKFGWLGRWRWYRHGLPSKIEKHGIDVLYSMSGIVNTVISCKCGTVCTVNNMEPFFLQHVSSMSILSIRKLRLTLLKKLYIKSARLADSYILHSNCGLQTMSQHAGDLKDKAFVVLTGVPNDISLDFDNPPPHPYGNKPYFLYLSALYSYKNHLNLIRAYGTALEKGEDLPDLIIAGYPVDTAYLARIRKEISRSRFSRKIK